MAKVIPYRLHLPKTSRDAVLAANSLIHTIGPDLHDRLSRAAAQLTFDLRVPTSLAHQRIDAARRSRSPLDEHGPGSPATFVRFHVGPSDQLVVIRIDDRIAGDIVDRLLGGDGTSPLIGARLAPLQCGLLEYAVLRALDAAVGDAKPPLTLLEITSSSQRGLHGTDGTWIVAVWSIAVGERASNMRVFAPRTLRMNDRAHLDVRVLRALPVTLTATVGQATLHALELHALQSGDVIILGEPSKSLSANGWAGRVSVRAGKRADVAVGTASPAVNQGFHRIAIEHILSREETRAVANETYTPAPSDPNDSTAVNAELLQRVPVTVVVELGRIDVSAATVGSLQVGETILIGRDPHDPLVLTAGGAALAEGELVDVDGELGFRVTKLLA